MLAGVIAHILTKGNRRVRVKNVQGSLGGYGDEVSMRLDDLVNDHKTLISDFETVKKVAGQSMVSETRI